MTGTTAPTAARNSKIFSFSSTWDRHLSKCRSLDQPGLVSAFGKVKKNVVPLPNSFIQQTLHPVDGLADTVHIHVHFSRIPGNCILFEIVKGTGDGNQRGFVVVGDGLRELLQFLVFLCQFPNQHFAFDFG